MFGSELAKEMEMIGNQHEIEILLCVVFLLYYIVFKGWYLTYFNIKCKFAIFVRFLFCFQIYKTLLLMAIGFLGVKFA